MPRSINDRLQTKTAFVNPTTATDTALVAAIPYKKIRVHSVWVVAGGANNVYFKSDTTALTATSNLATNGGFILAPSEMGWFVTATGEALNFTTSAAVATGCTITYSEEQ